MSMSHRQQTSRNSTFRSAIFVMLSVIDSGVSGNTMTRMRSFTLLFGFATLLLPVNSVAQAASTDDASKSGSICVLPNSPKPPTQISPGGMYNPDTLTVHLDNRDGVRWPYKTPVLIESLGLEAKHLVVLTSDGKPIQSVRFKFSDYHDAKLCICFDGYQGVQLGNRTDALWCKAKSRTCWR